MRNSIISSNKSMNISAKNKFSFQFFQIIAKNYYQNIGDKKH